MITVEPLRPEHLERFVPEVPLAKAIPAEHLGAAAVYLNGDRVLAICGGWGHEGVVEVGLAIAPEARDFPVSMHRLALEFFAGLGTMGFEKVVAERPDEARNAAWLLRLGFEPVDGVFEKCLKPR